MNNTACTKYFLQKLPSDPVVVGAPAEVLPTSITPARETMLLLRTLELCGLLMIRFGTIFLVSAVSTTVGRKGRVASCPMGSLFDQDPG